MKAVRAGRAQAGRPTHRQAALSLCVYLLPFRTSSFQSLPATDSLATVPVSCLRTVQALSDCVPLHMPCLLWNALATLPHLANAYSLFKPSSNARFEPCKLLREGFSPMHLAAPSALPEHGLFSFCIYNRIQSAVYASASRSPLTLRPQSKLHL